MWFEVRDAIEADIPDIYKHVHEKFMQKYTDLDEKEAFDRHYNWYKEALYSNEHKIHIIYNENEKFIGQIRYEIVKTKARLGIYLLEEARGKGIAEKALQRSIEMLTSEHKNIKKIIANIMDENEKSIFLFEKCGFKYVKTNIDMLKYIKTIS